MTKKKLNPQSAGRKPGSKNKTVNNSEKEILADTMVSISANRDPDWNGEGWASDKIVAIHSVLNRKGIATSNDRIPGRRGDKVEVSRSNRITDISRQLGEWENDRRRRRLKRSSCRPEQSLDNLSKAEAKREKEMCAEYNTFIRDPYKPRGSVFAFAEIRRFARYAEERIADTNPTRKETRLRAVLISIVGMLHFADHHEDASGRQILENLEEKALKQLDALAFVGVALNRKVLVPNINQLGP